MIPSRNLLVAVVLTAGLAWTAALPAEGPEAGPAVGPAVVAPAAAAPTAADRQQVELTPALRKAGVTELDLGPNEPEVDRFNPDKRAVRPALGGRAIMHIASEPPVLNFAINNSAVINWIWRDIHAGLTKFNMATWENEPDLATGWDVEDTLILKGGRDGAKGNVLFGKVSEDGDDWVVTSGSARNPIERTVVPKSEAEAVERETVWTFRLRDAKWQDDHPFDSGDVVFSWRLYDNPYVDCDEKRYKWQDVLLCEALDLHTVRFFWKEQYFGIDGSYGFDLPILPSHAYNLADPDNPDYAPEFTQEEEGEFINKHPNNVMWVGLGPYKLTTWERGQYLEAKKWDGYWNAGDPARSGYLDTLRWRKIDDDNVAMEALINGDIDIFYRVKSEDFFGEKTQLPAFTRNYYKAFSYCGNIGYTSWNLYRKKFADVDVRKALAQAFDIQGWIDTNYKGYALWATGTQFWFGPAYDHDVKGYPYDVEAAQDLLADAGWYDRDGNGIIDKDGEDFVIEALMPSGNKASEKFLQALQDAYSRVGIKVVVQPYEWGTFLEHILNRDFDACNLGWVLNSPESDPYQLWYSSEAEFDKRSSNHPGLRDDEVDRLIDAGRRELDDEKRWAIWHQLHQRIYELQPYLFGWNVPRKMAFNKHLRGVKLYKFEPGFRLQDLYYEEGTPGTRPITD